MDLSCFLSRAWRHVARNRRPIFGLVFVAAILIDVMFKPVGPLLMAVIEKGSSDETEMPLLKTMNKSRFWVHMVYLLLVIIAFIGTTKFF